MTVAFRFGSAVHVLPNVQLPLLQYEDLWEQETTQSLTSNVKAMPDCIPHVFATLACVCA